MAFSPEGSFRLDYASLVAEPKRTESQVQLAVTRGWARYGLQV